MRKIILLLMGFLLIACQSEQVNSVEDVIVFTDEAGNEYATFKHNDLLWMAEDLRVEEVSGALIIPYAIEGDDTKLYDTNMLSVLEPSFADGWRLPNSEEWEALLTEYSTIDTLISSDFNLTLAGMYDFTGVYQWQEEGCLYIAKDDEKLTYFFYDGKGDTMKTGNFHPDDGFAIRLVKSTK